MRLMSLVLVLTFSFAPITVEAQQGQKVYGVGFLSSESASPSNGREPLRQELRDLGYVDGQNALIEARFAEYELDRLPALAAELVRLRMDVSVTFSTPAALAAKQATQTIPIVMSSGGDPVGSGLAASLARPGGNVTGLTHLAGPGMWVKVLESLKEIAPKISRVGVLRNSGIPPEVRGFELLQEPARKFGLSLFSVEFRAADELPRAFDTMLREHVDAFVASESPLNLYHRRAIANFAIQQRLPTAFGHRGFVDAGGLVSYGASFANRPRQAATYVDKILKGAKPPICPLSNPRSSTWWLTSRQRKHSA
ncbi:MAG TPA: ABC transporter substrate-binding protein [Methylomirabilota bacterium]|jgi:putative ABC transport system substrate-binding protein